LRHPSTDDTGDCRTSDDDPPPPERYVLEAFRCEGRIRACLFSFTRNFADTEELLQETYIRLLTMKPSNRRGIEKVYALVLVIARNLAHDWLRHQKVVPISLLADLDSEISDEGAQPDELLDLEQELELLADIVESMPPRRRQVFDLRKIYGMSQKEIARALGVTENTVEQHLMKAARHFAEAFTARRQADVLFQPPKTLSRHWRNRLPIKVG
jgi:RNA polymerase sigma factor (sigma-70 family)